MTSGQRTHYFARLWPAACAAQGWNYRDEALRRRVTRECMAKIQGPDTDSTSALGQNELTALFVYLQHLATPAALVVQEEWNECQRDYVAFNVTKQANWWEKRAYGAQGSGRLDRTRFPLRGVNRKEEQDRLMTLRARAKAKGLGYEPEPVYHLKPPGIYRARKAPATTPVEKTELPF